MVCGESDFDGVGGDVGFLSEMVFEWSFRSRGRLDPPSPLEKGGPEFWGELEGLKLLCQSIVGSP